MTNLLYVREFEITMTCNFDVEELLYERNVMNGNKNDDLQPDFVS